MAWLVSAERRLRPDGGASGGGRAGGHIVSELEVADSEAGEKSLTITH